MQGRGRLYLGLLGVVFALGACKSREPWTHCKEAPETPLARAPDVVGACRPLFKPVCRDALGRAKRELSQADGVAIARECAAAYCGELADQPLCKLPADGEPRAAREGFRSLVAAALAGTPGAKPAEVEAVALAMADQIISQKTLALVLRVDQGKLRIAIANGPEWQTSLPPMPAEISPIVAELRARRVDPGVLLEEKDDVPRDSELALVRAFREAGFESVICRKDAKNCR